MENMTLYKWCCWKKKPIIHTVF